ncbi:MAG: DEAD/DEAH box helicase [Saprospiraceae bacterium]
MTFQDLKLTEPILEALKKEGYEKPTPIQEKSIPIVLERKDLLACAQTGTGKTAAFAIPMLQILAEDLKLSERTKGPKALILTPTRELAIQIMESFEAYGRYIPLKRSVIFGGVSQHPQVTALKQGSDIIVATPGRLLDLMSQGHIDLRSVKIFVLDEADRMLDMGFVNDVKKIIARLPKQRQTLFFSATMPNEIQSLADSILTKPERVSVTPISSTANTIDQSIFYVGKKDKNSLLVHLLKDSQIQSALVFTRTKHGADKVVKVLSAASIKAAAIHGNKSQNLRQAALQDFKNRKIRVLVATDIAARGIDVDDLSHVINFELPEISETYVHRIGRTGRAGNSGIAFSFCDIEERLLLRDIQKLIGKQVPVNVNHPYPLSADVTENVNNSNQRKLTPNNSRRQHPASKPRLRWHNKVKV